jgi:UDP-3-O-[3-hydroxymyristoyl] glucosamine N-acyltransferase
LNTRKTNEINAIQIAEWVNGTILKGDESVLISGVNSMKTHRRETSFFFVIRNTNPLLSKYTSLAVLIPQSHQCQFQTALHVSKSLTLKSTFFRFETF